MEIGKYLIVKALHSSEDFIIIKKDSDKDNDTLFYAKIFSIKKLEKIIDELLEE